MSIVKVLNDQGEQIETPATTPKRSRRRSASCATSGCTGKAEEGGFCPDCSKTMEVPGSDLSAEGEDSTPEGSEASTSGETQDPPTGEKSKVPPRPSLDVAIDSHASISLRLLPFFKRMRSWDIRKLESDLASRFLNSITNLENNWQALQNALESMRRSGFVAKTTIATRTAAKLRPGDSVQLTDKQYAIFSQLYSKEELDDLTVIASTSTHVFLTGPTHNIGALRICHIKPKQPNPSEQPATPTPETTEVPEESSDC